MNTSRLVAFLFILGLVILWLASADSNAKFDEDD